MFFCREMIPPFCIGGLGGEPLLWTSRQLPRHERRLRRFPLSFQGIMTTKGCSSGRKGLDL